MLDSIYLWLAHLLGSLDRQCLFHEAWAFDCSGLLEILDTLIRGYTGFWGLEKSYFFTYWSNYKSWQFVLFFQKENPHLSQGICIPAPAGKFSHWKMSVPKTFVKSQQNNSTPQCLNKLIQNQNYNFHHKKTSTKSSGPMFVCYSYWETILPEITLNCYNKCKIVEMYHGENVSL